ncbi:MAG TPA: hypothetical protein EYH38_01295 [Leucothrix sp.]|nr:hypothetical protein [Leucothrix sp.]
MTSFSLNDGLYINITPRGAYYAVHDNDTDITQNILSKLLQFDETPNLSSETMTTLFPDDDYSLLHRMQKLGLVSGQKEAESIPDGNLEHILPELLGSLSDTGKALLADKSGLYLGTSGFPHEAAEELAAISASLSEVYQKHKGLLQGNMGFSQHAWGLVDAAGNAEVGFWPLYVDNNIFTLILHGLPQLNQPAFKHLVWMLIKRYANKK